MDQTDDYAESEYPRLLEPENLVPLIVMAVMAGLFFAFLLSIGDGGIVF